MPEITDWHSYLAKQEAKKRAEQERQKLAVAPVVRDQAHKAQQVVDHPAWQWFLDQLEGRIKAVESRRTTTMNKMVFGTAMGHELELLKIELNAMDAEIAGLRYAADLAPKTVELGQQYAGESRQVAAGRADT